MVGTDNLFAKPSIVGWSILLSGLINPLAIAIVILVLSKKYLTLTRTLRTIQLAMLVFPCIIFYALYPQHIYLREGCVIWVAGMLLILFSIPLSADQEKRAIS